MEINFEDLLCISAIQILVIFMILLFSTPLLDDALAPYYNILGTESNAYTITYWYEDDLPGVKSIVLSKHTSFESFIEDRLNCYKLIILALMVMATYLLLLKTIWRRL